MPTLVCRIKDGIQPFERRLALDELRALGGDFVSPWDGDEATASAFILGGAFKPKALRQALAYWRSIGPEPEGLTAQVRAEATLAVAHNGTTLADLCRPEPWEEPVKLPRKRCLRYATHGLHEYRGKFFPQLVRALINVAQVPPDGVILDPMGGSGTTLVEARLAGHTAHGLDINPLSVFIADVKCQALAMSPRSLAKAYEDLEEALSGRLSTGERPYFDALPERDQAYLSRWFPPSVLNDLDVIQQNIANLESQATGNYFRVCLSNILRGVSWQKTDDLRVRREVQDLPQGESIRRFLKESLRSTKAACAFHAQRLGPVLGQHAMHEADARHASSALPESVGAIHTVITSPPYATALPYIDTDRLSLVYLGLLPRESHRSRDLLMIGNREVTERRRADYWRHFVANRELLPQATSELIERIHDLNANHAVGFRRKNLPALLAKYFFDMREVLAQILLMLRSEGTAYMVVGNNRTTAGGELVEIETADHLTGIAESLGFRKLGDVPMEMLSSREIHRKNAMPSERIVVLQRA